MKAIEKSLIGLFILTIGLAFSGCKTEPEVKTEEKTNAEETIPEEVVEVIPEEPKIPLEERAFTYEGMIKGNIPVFIHFTEQDSILSGEITYLNTKARKPIRIIGEVSENYYRILEFNKKALITGIMSLTKKGDQMTGTWFVSGMSESFKMKITKSDSIVRKQDLKADPTKVFGDYAYRYTKNEGNTGSFSIRKKNVAESLFEILGVHSAPGYNIASIEECTVPFDGSKTEFDFLIPEEESCDFNVRFYKDFAVVRYINGYCQGGYFGHNATVEGVFLKVE